MEDVERLERLERLYAEIPEFACREHCSECCGPVSWYPAEDLNIRRYLAEHGLEYKTRRLGVDIMLRMVEAGDDKALLDYVTCPYVENDRCVIYPVRPLVCRLQGVYPEKLPCPYVKPGKTLTKEEVDQIWRELNEISYPEGE